MAADKQLIIVVEGTATTGFHWSTIVNDYLKKIVRIFCENGPTEQSDTSIETGSSFELALVMFNTRSYSGALFMRSGWTRSMENFLDWLSSIRFVGGGLENAATTDGLADALMMFAIPENGYMTEQNLVGKRHCILIASNNPEPLPSPVYRPNIQNCGPATLLSDAETVARWFGLCSVSLSVICTRKLPKIRALYEAGKRNPNAEDPPVRVQQPQFLVLISEGFMEARAALAPTGLAPYQDSVQPLDTNLAASSSYQPENPPREQSYSGASMSAYGAIAGDLQPVDATLGSCSATSYGNRIFPVDLPQPSGYFQGEHSAGLNVSAASMFPSQESSIPLPAPQSKYVKLWEGNLSGKMHGKAVLITRLEAYRTTSTSEMLAATWPDSMEIHRILTRDSVNRNFNVRSAVILVFKVLTNHAFLSQLLERNLSAVVELPCQTLLLSATDNVNILIGLIFPTIQDGQTSNFGIAATPPLQGGQLQHHPSHPAI